MQATEKNIDAASTMAEVLEAFPGAQRALFRKYHIGGCSSCGFAPEETLGGLCERNNKLDVAEVVDHIRSSHEQDETMWMSPTEVDEARKANPELKILDIRTREEFDAVHIDGTILMDQQIMQEIMGHWDRGAMFVILDHQGAKALDAAAYFLGHGFTHIRCMRGGIDAWSQEVDSKVQRYRLG